MKKFKSHGWKMEIQEVEVLRETPEFVVYWDEFYKKERRERKAGAYFNSFEDAKAHFVNQFERELQHANDRRSQAISNLAKAKAVTAAVRKETATGTAS